MLARIGCLQPFGLHQAIRLTLRERDEAGSTTRFDLARTSRHRYRQDRRSILSCVFRRPGGDADGQYGSQLRWRDHKLSRAAGVAALGRRDSINPQGDRPLSKPGSGDGQLSLLDALRVLGRDHHRHVRDEPRPQDRSAGHDIHGRGGPPVHCRIAGVAGDEPPVHDQYRDREHDARCGGLLPHQGWP